MKGKGHDDVMIVWNIQVPLLTLKTRCITFEGRISLQAVVDLDVSNKI